MSFSLETQTHKVWNRVHKKSLRVNASKHQHGVACCERVAELENTTLDKQPAQNSDFSFPNP